MKIKAGPFKRYSPIVIFLAILTAAAAFASPDDYDPVTGEPKCMECHRPDKKYSIDYSREPACFECHGPGLSDSYIAINKRYRVKESGGEKPLPLYAKASKKTASKKDHGKLKDMAYVPGGEFTMGSDDWWPKVQPAHIRNLKGFYIDKFEVTNARYKAFVDATKARPPLNWPGGEIPEGRKKHPVSFVTWYDADAFCRWEGKRLPTDAEWEKAARGTDKRAFPWGNKFHKDKANTPQYGYGGTLPVGSFPEGVSPYGVYDMAGNVWEWTSSWMEPYPGNTHPDENYGKRFKVLKGGSWYDCTYYKCGISAPSYNRVFFNPKTSNNNFGFRCAKDE
ncbi:MAG: formylglycine-generating enzyme family protein [Thermodesulfobacteriota bacterium]